jgi:AraC-like DNA-binding protein
MQTAPKKRDGFTGEKLISIPKKVLKKEIEGNPLLNALYITYIGYFPKAHAHFRERKKGCEDNILIYCMDGKGWYVTPSGQHEITANQFIILPATTEYMKYGADKDDPWTIFWVHFSGNKLKALNQFFSIENFLAPNFIKFDNKRLQLWEEMYNSLEMGYTINNIAYANFSLYYFIASFIFPEKRMELSKNKEETVIDKTIAFMKEHTHLKLTVEEMATKFAFYSTSYFSQLFRQKTGMSPMDYFIHLKIQHACRLLDLTDIRIKEVADQVGYTDPYYFSRIFHNIMGLSPNQYRNTKKG